MSKFFRQKAAYLIAENKKYPTTMAPLEVDALPPGCIAVWRSGRFLAQIFEATKGGQRISINRTMIDTGTGEWVDGITWEQIQRIKSELGFGDRIAVEIYPEDNQVVNVANMRHIWLVEDVPFAWRKA